MYPALSNMTIKVLSFDNKIKNVPFYFVLSSLNRTFALAFGSPPYVKT